MSGEYGTYVATRDISFGYVLAFHKGDAVPVSHVQNGVVSLNDVTLAPSASPDPRDVFDERIAGELTNPNSASTVALRAASVAVVTGNKRPTSNLAVVLGDSRSTRSTFPGPDWFTYLCALSKQRIKLGGIYATPGYTVQQIRDTLLPQVLALTGSNKPGAAFILAGTNNHNPVAPDVWDFAATKAAYIQILDALIGAGIVPIICLDGPVTGGTGNETTWDRWLVEYAQRRGLLSPIDFYGALVDRQAGGIKAVWASDNKHQNPLGSKRMAQYAIDSKVLEYFPPAPRVTLAGVADPLNVLSASIATFNTDSNSDGIASSWALSGTGDATATRVLPADSEEINGYWQRMTRTYPLAVAGAKTLITSPTSLIGSSWYHAGDVIEFAHRLRVTGAEATGATYRTYLSVGTGQDIRSTLDWGIDGDFIVYKREVVNNVAAGNSSVQIRVNDPTAAGTVQVDVAEVTVRNLTTGQILT